MSARERGERGERSEPGDYDRDELPPIRDWSGQGKTEPEESCNAYYHRKQQPNVNQVSGDVDIPLQGRDDSFAEERNYGERTRSHINQKTGRDRY